jgi:hypothetical protein
MKMTLLDMTQSILSSMGSDQVNSIGDTVESQQVADILKQTYFNMLGRYDLPEHNRIIQLDPSNDATKPTLMFRPAGVHRIEWIKYFNSNPSSGSQTDQFGAFSHGLNTDIIETSEEVPDSDDTGIIQTPAGYQDVLLLPFDNFISMVNEFDPSETNIGSYQLGVFNVAEEITDNFTVYYRSDKQPQYAAVLANYYILFDSFDSSQDSTLQASKTEAMCWLIPEWSMTDTFIPLMDEQQFPLMLNDAKSLAFTELKQMPHQKAEDEVARQLVSLQKWKAISGKPTYFDEIPSFGRRGGSLSGYNSNFRGPRWSA